MSPREVPKNFTGPHLIFSSMGDDDNDPNGCWSYVGRQGAQGGKAGQTVNLGSAGCFFIGTVVHEIMHGLGQYDKLTTEECYRRNNMVKYYETLEKMLSQCQETIHPKTQGKGRAKVFIFYLYTRIHLLAES